MSDHQLQQEHTSDAIAARIVASQSHTFVGDFILGAVDGAITTFAIVAGVAGADFSISIAIVLGVANLLADGFSMAVSNYLKARSDQQVVIKFRKMEEMHIDLIPEGEREEIRQIYSAKGFEGELLDQVVETICDDRQRWVDTMLTEEWGLQIDTPSPWKSGLVTFLGFLIAGSVPLIPLGLTFFGLYASDIFAFCTLLTGFAFVLIGVFRAKVLHMSVFVSVIETLGTGSLAAGIAYFAGILLSKLMLTA
ncbi:MAG: VIT1/CCC1 transporter family protein [Pirellulales bacterium]